MKLILTILFAIPFAIKAQLYFPPTTGNQWDTLSLNSIGWCADSVNALYSFLENEQTDAFIVLKNGKIVLEKYFGTYTADSSHVWNSASKSLTATLVGIAQEDNLIDIQHKSSDYLGSGWTSLPQNQEDSITIWHQLTMTSGLDESNFFCTTPSCLNYIANAGDRWAYHNGPYLLLMDIIENASGQTLNAYTNNEIESTTGMSGTWLNLIVTKTYYSVARDMARFGLLIQNGGNWNGTPVLGDQNYMNEMRSPSQLLNPSYGYLWWLNGQSSYVLTGPTITIPGPVAPDAPIDVYAAAGADGQFISISPSNGLVMIRQGETGTGAYTEFPLHNEIWRRLLQLDCTNSLSEMTEQNSAFYPNPTSNEIRFYQKNVTLEVRMFDSIGRKVIDGKFENQLNVSHLNSGTYIIEIDGNGAKSWSRIVIN